MSELGDINLALEHLLASLLDEDIPAGTLRQIVRSCRQSVIEGERQTHQSPGIAALASELRFELLEGGGFRYTDDEG